MPLADCNYSKKCNLHIIIYAQKTYKSQHTNTHYADIKGLNSANEQQNNMQTKLTTIVETDELFTTFIYN